MIGALVGLLIAVIAAYAMAVRRRQFEHAPEPELLYDVPLISAVPAFNQSAWLPHRSTSFDGARRRAGRTDSRHCHGPPVHREPASVLGGRLLRGDTTLGSTAMVANTGLALAKMEERVLVVDGDPINRGLTMTLTDTEMEQPLVSPRPGFSEVVGGRPLTESVTPADANHRLGVVTASTDPNLAMHRWSPQSIRLALRDRSASTPTSSSSTCRPSAPPPMAWISPTPQRTSSW